MVSEMKEINKADFVEFLEKCLGRKVISYVLSSGTNPGDNYMSCMYSIDVECSSSNSSSSCIKEDQEDTKSIHLLCKCYPSQQSDREFLNESNFFWKELSIYNTLVPELIKFQETIVDSNEILIPALPPFIAGQAVNFSSEDGEIYKKKNLFHPLDQYIIMMDMRKSKEFEMSSKKISMNIDEVSLTIQEIAKIHALSWSYKQKHNMADFPSVFPFLKFTFKKKIWGQVLDTNFKMILNILEYNLGVESPIVAGTRLIRENYWSILDAVMGGRDDIDLSNLLRVKTEGCLDQKVPWKVMIHGDVWVNNLLFRKNKITGKAEEVSIVDLQTCRERCPTTDFINLFYTSTDASFQKLHFDEMAKLYVDNFNNCCNILKTKPLPGFCLESFKLRLRTAKLFGYLMMVVGIPFMLNDSEQENIADVLNSINTQQSDTDKNSQEIPPYLHNIFLRDRVVGIATTLYEEGII